MRNSSKKFGATLQGLKDKRAAALAAAAQGYGADPGANKLQQPLPSVVTSGRPNSRMTGILHEGNWGRTKASRRYLSNVQTVAAWSTGQASWLTVLAATSVKNIVTNWQ